MFVHYGAVNVFFNYEGDVNKLDVGADVSSSRG